MDKLQTYSINAKNNFVDTEKFLLLYSCQVLPVVRKTGGDIRQE